MAFGGRGVNPAGSNDPIAVQRERVTHASTQVADKMRAIGRGTHLVEGHLLRYASGLAAASGASLPHRSNGRVSSQGAAGLVVPAAVAAEAVVAADTTGRPEGMIFQGRATAHRDRGWHSRRDVDDNNGDGNDGNTRGDRPRPRSPSREGIPTRARTPSFIIFLSLCLSRLVPSSFLSSLSTASLRSLVAPRCRSADLPGGSRPIWHSSGGHRSRERGLPGAATDHGLGRYAGWSRCRFRDAVGQRIVTTMTNDERTEYDTIRENTRHRRVSRDVTAARGDVDVNRGRDAAQSRRPSHRPRDRPRPFLGTALFILSPLFLPRAYLYPRQRYPQTDGRHLAFWQSRNGPECLEWRGRRRTTTQLAA
ncbi:hypothetical protein ALC60_12246 [Trachymyrmex zeteki]|uniref:Uncharacterized protein n=1 Tax=Mycetomoellerius zeteki TaxID=64791 RepID=A0A151WLP6_9HYME|nr:hypothetical protein ALC60_12246 [Trachymyrmex zeteki]